MVPSAITGCAFRYAGELGKIGHFCGNRADANLVGSCHVTALSAVGIISTSSEGGAGFDILAAMRLELILPEFVEAGLITVASMIALFLFSTRDEEGRAGYGVLKHLFNACWLAASLTLTCTSQTAQQSRLRSRREASNRQQRDGAGEQQALPVNADGVVLPRAWSGIMVSLSFFTYTAPQAIRLARPHFGQFRGAIGGFSNLCFVAHFLMLANNRLSSAPRLSVAHLAVHNMGAACSFGADARDIGVTGGLALSYLIGFGGNAFELLVWSRIVKPTLHQRNPTLVAELPVMVFRWLFQRGVLSMALYCYFEALGVGFSDRDAEDVTPWLIANSTVLMHLTFSGALSLTLLADSRTSISAVLRGLAPLRVTVALTVVFITSLIPLLIFAGREHGTRQQQQLYRTANTSFMLLWVVIISILAAPPYNSTAQQVQSGCSVEDDEGGLTCRQRHVLSFSAASGGGVVTAGI